MMMTHQRLVWFFSILMLLLIFPSCLQKSSLTSPSSQTRDDTLSQARQNLKAGKYQKAIDLYQAEHEKHPQDRTLVAEYAKSLSEIKASADRAMDRENFGTAGRAYLLLVKNYPDVKAFAHLLSFDSAQLHSRLASCKTALSRQGLQEYRKGNLNEAIALWQDYLVLDPNNTDVKKALQTARTQQKNLQ